MTEFEHRSYDLDGNIDDVRSFVDGLQSGEQFVQAVRVDDGYVIFTKRETTPTGIINRLETIRDIAIDTHNNTVAILDAIGAERPAEETGTELPEK